MSISETDAARERLLTQVLSARTLPQIAAATEALRRWLKEHPDETGLEDGFGQLAMMAEAAKMGEMNELELSPDAQAGIPVLV